MALQGTIEHKRPINYNLDIVNTLLSISNYIFKGIDFLFGVLGLIISLPILLFISIILWGFLLILNHRVKNLFQDIYNGINNAEQEEIIKTHLMIEKSKLELDKLIKNKISKGAKVPLLMKPTNSLVVKIHKKFIEGEKILKKAAYPELERQPSPEDIKRLSKTFSNAQDWDDPNLDVYEKTYL